MISLRVLASEDESDIFAEELTEGICFVHTKHDLALTVAEHYVMMLSKHRRARIAHLHATRQMTRSGGCERVHEVPELFHVSVRQFAKTQAERSRPRVCQWRELHDERQPMASRVTSESIESNDEYSLYNRVHQIMLTTSTSAYLPSCNSA